MGMPRREGKLPTKSELRKRMIINWRRCDELRKSRMIGKAKGSVSGIGGGWKKL